MLKIRDNVDLEELEKYGFENGLEKVVVIDMLIYMIAMAKQQQN